MSCLPVIPEEIDDFERRLGVKLPPYYKASMLDVRVQKALASEGVGTLRLGDTMQQYAVLTESIRREQPEFPQDGVLMSVAVREDGSFDYGFGYPRFFLPAKHDPSQLEDVVYTWDSSRNRKSRDCSTKQWIDSSVDCVDEDILAELGLEKPNVWEPKPPQIRTCDSELMTFLELRGNAATEAYEALAKQWMTCAELMYRGKYLCPCDLGQVPDHHSSISVPINPGLFRAEVQLEKSALGDWLIIGRVRIVSGRPDYSSSRKVGMLDIDHAALAIFDRQAFFRKVPVDDREFVSMDLMDLETKPCVVMLGQLPIFVVPTGDCDGSYLVLELRDNDVPIGIEVRFKDDTYL